MRERLAAAGDDALAFVAADRAHRVDEPPVRRQQSAGMLEHARGLLAPGGRLVYSVCTIRRDECEGVVAGGRQTLPHRDHTDGFYVAVA